MIFTKIKSQIPNIVAFLLLIITLLILSNLGNFKYVVPKIDTIFKALGGLIKSIETYKLIFLLLGKILLCCLISLLIAIVLVVLSYVNKFIEKFISFYISIIKVIPVISISMILLLLFFDQKIRFVGTMIVACMVITPILFETILQAFKNINKDILDEAKLIGLNTKSIIYIYIPLTIKTIIASVMASFGLGLKVIVMNEVIFSVPNSIGKIIHEASLYNMMDLLYAWTIILIVIVVICDFSIRRISKMKLLDY